MGAKTLETPLMLQVKSEVSINKSRSHWSSKPKLNCTEPRFESTTVCIFLISVCALPWTPRYSYRRKKSSPFFFAPLSSCLGVCYIAALDPELTHCLNALSERVLSSFPVSVQDQPDHVHFICSVQPDLDHVPLMSSVPLNTPSVLCCLP